MSQAISVSQLNDILKQVIDNSVLTENLIVKGEVSNFINHIKTGHYYFTLKDKEASIKVVMFKSYAQTVKFNVENGMNLVVEGNVKFFVRDGICQLYATGLEPDGIGALYLAFEQLKQKLQKQGLFSPEHKKPIPTTPKKIGVVTSKTGAALQDILNILSRRYPVATVVIIEALVQGEKAARSIVDAIELAQTKSDIDVLIVGRGGGSIEDLWCFNEEIVANAIYNCTIPVISAVGHEIDFTISDFVSDLRAPTPSAAAELCTPDILDIAKQLQTYNILLYNITANKYKNLHDKLKLIFEKLKANSPMQKIENETEKLSTLSLRLEKAANDNINKLEKRFLKSVELLEALSPLKVLTRGYSITYGSDNTLLTSVKTIKKDEIIKTILSDGEIESIVI